MGKLEPTQFDNIGKVMKSPWEFRQYGESGHWVSDLFPHVAQQVDDRDDQVDDLEVLRAHLRELLPAHRVRAAGAAEHGGVGGLRPGQREPEPAGLHGAQRRADSARRAGQLQLGLPAGRPSRDRCSSRRTSRWRTSGRGRPGRSCSATSSTCCGASTSWRRGTSAATGALEAAIANYETAFRMQTAVPELMDLAGESEATHEAVRAGRRNGRARRSSAANACSPGDWSSAACGSSS